MARTTHLRFALAVCALVLASITGARAHAQDAAAGGAQLDRTPEDCVLMNRVSRNEAANDRQVVFFMRGNTYYRNDLDGACQSLTAGENRLVFHYRTRSAKITRLCDTDSFTVERQTSRIGCALGKFTPITHEEAGALLGRALPAPAASESGADERRERSSRRERD